MIAVTFALPSESRDFRRLLNDSNHEVAIFHTGVGAAACRERIEAFLDRQRFRFLLSSGFAGALVDSLSVGDLVLAQNYSDPDLLARADELLIAQIGRVQTTDTVIASAAEREKLARQNGALAVDMETAWIAQACAARSIPMLSLRVISDSAAAPFPAPPGVLFDLDRQKTQPLVLAKYLARHPSGVVRLTRFSRQIAAARSSLTSALTILVRELR